MLSYKFIPLIHKFLLNSSDFHIILDILDRKKTRPTSAGTRFFFAFLVLHLSISNDIVSTIIYDKRDGSDFKIVNFPFLDGDKTSLYIPQYVN